MTSFLAAEAVDPLGTTGAVTTALTYMVERIGSVITIVTGNPVLCLGIAMWAAGGAIGLFKRLV